MCRGMRNLDFGFRALTAYLFSKYIGALPRMQYRLAGCSGGLKSRETGRGEFARTPPSTLIGKLEESYPTDHGSTDECSKGEKPKAYIRHDNNPFQLVVRAFMPIAIISAVGSDALIACGP